MRIVSAILGAALLCFVAAASEAQDQLPQRSAIGQIPITLEDQDGPVTPQEEHLRRVNRAQQIEALDENLFGDSINNYTGALSFAVTDVSLPGNSQLSVSVARRFDPNDVRSRGGRFRSGHVFDDWDLDIPHMHGVFAGTVGWQAGPTPGLRCDQPNASLAPPPAVNGFSADDYWQGNQLYVPGQGDDEIQYLSASQSDRPTDGSTYRWVTKGLWFFSCLPTTANGVAGDAFLARDPAGNRYWFNHIIEKSYAPLTLSRGTGTVLPRRQIVILPTRVEDRFGNWVTYTYDAMEPRNLRVIQANDGRRIDLNYATGPGNGPGGRISSVVAVGRTWTYGYSPSAVIGASLTSVTRPDGSQFIYDFSAFHEDRTDVTFEGCGSPAQFVSNFQFVATATHPSGAVGTFTFQFKQHGRGAVPRDCWTSPLNSSGDRYPPVFTSLSLIRKEINGPNQAFPMVWQWSYPALSWSYADQCPQNCPTTKLIEMTQPDSSVVRETYGVRYGNNDGLLLASEVWGRADPSIVPPTANVLLRRTEFVHSLSPAGQAYLGRVGAPVRLYGDASTGVFKPVVRRSVVQQGATFSWAVASTNGVFSLDRFARPLQSTAESSLGFSAAQVQSYFDLDSAWVIGLPAALSVNGVEQQRTQYSPQTALPTQVDRFGQRRQSFTHRADGTIETITDNLSNVTQLGNWRRGVPQSIVFFDGSSQSSIVDDNGWVTSTTNEVGGVTTYQYDGLGRITGIVYPTDTLNTWASTTRTFRRTEGVEYGLPAGTWKQTISTGNFRRHVWYDNMWQPRFLREWDETAPAATERFVRTIHWWRGDLLYKTYAFRGVTDIAQVSYGVIWTYDALGRIVLEEAGAKSNNILTTRYAYESSPAFQTRVTNPLGVESTLQYFALDEPSDAFPTRVDRGVNRPATEQSSTLITRDIWGKVLSMQRTGNGASAVRSMIYDSEQRLCQLVEPESAAIVMAYDLGGNLAWSAEGRPAQATCALARNAVPAADRIVRGYDRRNRLTSINYPETPNLPTADTTFGYTPDGQIALAAAGNIQWDYEYNSLRLPELESMNFGGRTYRLDWQYDIHGAVSGLIYPNGESVGFNPTALGQARQNGTFATAATYHPSGATAGWTFGNGIVRSATENARALPDRLRDVGGAVIFDEDYDYDQNGNVVRITDARDALQTRTLSYDAQDRLSGATGPWGSGTLTYDGADNLKTQVIGAKNYTYAYTNQKLSTITSGATTLIGFQYDARGNQIGKNSQGFQWDLANRIAVTPGKARYRYDAHGRRALIETLSAAGAANGERTVQVYSKNGVLLYEERSGATVADPNAIFSNGFEAFGEAPTGPVTKTTYHYLAGALVARKDTSPSNSASVTYLHTDFLGSVVAETNASQTVTRRTSYQPFGLPGGSVAAGPGYTGHVFDPGIGLTYMQGRYYDPDVGRFLSMDPNPPSMADGLDFNRYAYVRNNPYRNVDPDGRVVETVWDIANIGIGIVSFGKNVAAGNVAGAAIDAVGVVVDTVATVVPGVPGGAGTAIKVARTADAATDIKATVGAAESATDAARTTPDGVVYLRRDPVTGDCYVGQCKSSDRFDARQKEHDRDLDVQHEYEILGRAEPGVELDVLEETKIRELGGLAREGGSLSNKRHQMRESRYRDNGGELDDPTKNTRPRE